MGCSASHDGGEEEVEVVEDDEGDCALIAELEAEDGFLMRFGKKLMRRQGDCCGHLTIHLLSNPQTASHSHMP